MNREIVEHVEISAPSVVARGARGREEATMLGLADRLGWQHAKLLQNEPILLTGLGL